MKKLLVLLLFLAGLAAAGLWWQRQRSERPAQPLAYTLVPVEYGKLVETVSATGVVVPRQLFIVGVEGSGRLVEMTADFNDEVAEGQVLFRLDDQALRQQRDQAKSAIEGAAILIKQAEAARDTEKKMLEREDSRPSDIRREIEVQVHRNRLAAADAAVEAARNKVASAEQSLALAELALSKAVIRVPAYQSPAGKPGIGTLAESTSNPTQKYVVLERKASLGQLVGGATAAHVYTLAGSFDVVQIEAQVAEGDIGKVAKGLEAEFTVASYPDDQLFRGKVIEVRPLPVNERGAVFYKVLIEAQNKRDAATGRWCLTPGLTATIDIVRQQHNKAWKVPAMALSFQPDETKLSEAAREKLRRWQDVKDRDSWRPVWTLGEDRTPWPLFVRIGGVDANGSTGIRDLAFTEVLEWDAELKVKPEADKPQTYPEVIIAAPPTKSGGFSLKF